MKNPLKNKAVDIAIAIVVAAIFATGPPFWWQYLTGHKETPAPTVPLSGVIGFHSGCEPYQVYAQNRWAPYGVAVRTAPDVLAKQISSFDGNHSVAVDGWVHGSVAYPTNQPPFNSDIWFHLADGSGWVSFAGVRAVPTDQDPTGLADGGQSAPTPPSCQGSAQ